MTMSLNRICISNYAQFFLVDYGMLDNKLRSSYASLQS